MALNDGNTKPEEVGYLNAHGTSTQLNDKIETKAIKDVFGDHAKKLKISSIKSMIGHSLGAAGGIEAVVCAKVLKEGVVPPTINLENPDLGQSAFLATLFLCMSYARVQRRAVTLTTCPMWHTRTRPVRFPPPCLATTSASAVTTPPSFSEDMTKSNNLEQQRSRKE